MFNMQLGEFKRVISGDYACFIFARAIGLVAKPLLLMLTMRFGEAEQTGQLASTFLVLTSVFFLLHVPFHFDFYQELFMNSKRLEQIRRTYTQYIENLLSHVLLMTPIIFCCSLLLVKSLSLACLLAFALPIEKLYDEQQRMYLFEKEYKRWSVLFLLKSSLPCVSYLLALYVRIPCPVAVLVIVNLSTVIVAYLYMVPCLIVRHLLKVLKAFRYRCVVKYLGDLKREYFARFSLSLLRSNVMSIDKWIIAVLYSGNVLGSFVLVGQFGNLVTVGMNYVTIANRRKQLLDSNNTFSSLLYKGKAVVCAAGLVLVSFVVVYLYKKFISTQFILDALEIVFLMLTYGVYAVSEIFSEYLQWNCSPKIVSKLELIFAIVVVLLSVLVAHEYGYQFLPMIFFMVGFVRLATIYALTSRTMSGFEGVKIK